MKPCTNCHNRKHLSNFRKCIKSKDVYQWQCKTCRCQYDKQNYYSSEKRRTQIRAGRLRNAYRNRIWLFEYLEKHPCVDCGETNVVVLEFDHVRGHKFLEVSKPLGYAISSASD